MASFLPNFRKYAVSAKFFLPLQKIFLGFKGLHEGKKIKNFLARDIVDAAARGIAGILLLMNLC